jgi:hypothetical protein
MKVFLSALLFASSLSTFAAENCQITIPSETPDTIRESLVKKGFTITEKSAADYELAFDEFVARPIFENGGYRALGVNDTLVAVKGSLIMKVNKFKANGKKSLEFARQANGSVSTCNGKCITDIKEGKALLYAQLINSNKFANSVPSCRAVK